ncbi:hypothetical protein PTKU64_53940 [Paraburkholderia terrae]|uniref:Secreted protein n=1 Tax=Paraburkholderia terrae TaxID=311230 RepID=A0ABM7TSI3_9BURK|nr:hypothetical protein PTKU64_53940 [Paraburkholderia terrae]
MSVVAAVMVVAVVVINVRYDLMFVHRPRLAELVSSRFVTGHFRRSANHRDGRKRLNRKAQCKQHDEKEFAPVRHGCKV